MALHFLSVLWFFGIAVCILNYFNSNYVSKGLCVFWYSMWSIVAVIKILITSIVDRHFCSGVKTNLKESYLDMMH